ncbi:restriction endonuclease subunit S [Adhaeribacter rhizoryzae]|uniref:Restriction endonuclease n=1 Tax=Adhaeribacter rhizoryzae TaxID=2607907 RepID=A0A5M6DRE5_9BACT|nr:restriction endonuclease subunit S [Adhaeribacter rhizoryzae]KAA5548822.1 restriction endonuclease [Adhaeribacter rhizoryzae]
MEQKEHLDNLPKGWVWSNISELFIIIGGGTPSKKHARYWGGDIKWASVKDIKSQFITETIDKITNEGLKQSNTNLASNGDIILVTRISPGQVSIAKDKISINQDLKILKLFGGVIPSFVYFLIKTNNQKFISKASGTTVKGLKVSDLNKIKLPLPPIKEQSRIIIKIEELFSEIDHAHKNLQKAKDDLYIYRQSVLKSAFDGKLTANWRTFNTSANALDELQSIQKERQKEYNLKIKQKQNKKPKADYDFVFEQDTEISTWANAKLENLIDINARIGWRGLTQKEYTREGPLFLSVHALNYGKNVVFHEANHITQERYDESPEIKLQVNDILLCKDGAGIGKVGIINHLPADATVNSSLLVIKAREAFNPTFLYYFFTGPTIQKLVNEKISGSAIPHLFQKDIKNFNLKVPPIEEQNKIVEILETRFTLIENLEKVINKSLKDIELFKHSTLKKAFEGNLVNQDALDEPANILLERIKIEKEAYLKAQKEAEKSKPKKEKLMESKKIVLNILKEAERPISALELWQSSIHEDDVESFYNEIKNIYSLITEYKQETESFLTLNNEDR